VRTGTAKIYQLGNWLAYFAEPVLQIEFHGDSSNFLPWEMSLRRLDSMHTDALYRFALEPNLHLATLIIYVGYLGVLQNVSLKSRPTNPVLTLALFAFVQFILLLFAWMSHTGPGAFESQAIPFDEHWFPANMSGFLYVFPWFGITMVSVPYLWYLCWRDRPGRVPRRTRLAHGSTYVASSPLRER
jgi:hypothetical protein